MRVIGSVLVRNEDVFVEQAIRNAASFCDHIYAVDHVSNDETWPTLRRLERELDNLDVRRVRHSKISHEVLERHVGTDTWVLRVDGDELYDPARLAILRTSLEAGEYKGWFRLLGNVLHAVDVNRATGTASGYLSPPSRPITALYYLGALDTWTGCAERLHAGKKVFRPGYSWDRVCPLYEQFVWEESPLRCLHVCFLRRSSRDAGDSLRPNVGELGAYRRSVLGAAERALRRVVGRPAGGPAPEALRSGVSWKAAKYRRGELRTIDVSPFLDLT